MRRIVLLFGFAGLGGGYASTQKQSRRHGTLSEHSSKLPIKIGQFCNDGEALKLRNALSQLLLAFQYQSGMPNRIGVPRLLSTNIVRKSDSLMLEGYPQTSAELLERASAAVSRAKAAGVLRQVINMVIPRDTRTYTVLGTEIQGTDAPTDLDPWPGGLAQMYGVALPIGRRILKNLTGSAESAMKAQELSEDGGCGWILAEGSSAIDDAGFFIFPSADEIDQLAKVDAMVGDKRVLVILNPQFKSTDDFVFWKRGKAKETYFDKGYEVTFTFEETILRDESVKIIGEFGLGWRAFLFVTEGDPKGEALTDGYLPQKPEYMDLLAEIKKRYPERPWERQLKEAAAKRS